MSLANVFLQTINKLKSIKVQNPIVLPKPSNNRVKTESNVNDFFKTINVWDNQVDEMIKGDSYSFNTDYAIFVEYIPGDAKQLLNKVTSYPESVITFHIFSILLDGRDGTMERNIDIFIARDKTNSKIKGWSPDNCSSFMSCKDVLDYKHKNITKYILSYNFNFIDKTGSIFDVDSPFHLTSKSFDNPKITSISIFTGWISGASYTSNVSVVCNGYDFNKQLLVYLCKTDNSDKIFDLSNWTLIPEWKSKKKYSVDDYSFFVNTVFKCITDNEDSSFIPSNWIQITH